MVLLLFLITNFLYFYNFWQKGILYTTQFSLTTIFFNYKIVFWVNYLFILNKITFLTILFYNISFYFAQPYFSLHLFLFCTIALLQHVVPWSIRQELYLSFHWLPCWQWKRRFDENNRELQWAWRSRFVGLIEFTIAWFFG